VALRLPGLAEKRQTWAGGLNPFGIRLRRSAVNYILVSQLNSYRFDGFETSEVFYAAQNS
jgi:hypothetical protein